MSDALRNALKAAEAEGYRRGYNEGKRHGFECARQQFRTMIDQARNPNRNQYLDDPFEMLRLSGRPYNLLVREGYKTIGDLLGLPDEEFERIRFFGPGFLEELDKCLESIGLKRGPFVSIANVRMGGEMKQALRKAGITRLSTRAAFNEPRLRAHDFTGVFIMKVREAIEGRRSRRV